MEAIEINITRLEYLVELFGFTKKAFIDKLQTFYKTKKITDEDIFSEKINLTYLKKIDNEFFEKGLSFYTDPTNIINKKNRIFFRKPAFNTPLELEDRRIISKLEDKISYLNGLKILAREKEEQRKFRSYWITDDPKDVAQELKNELYPEGKFKEDRAFLKALIHKLAENNILVLEFIETSNKKEKSNFNGCFIAPNNIIIKRQQDSFKREIFTLAHELAHYLLNNEELDQINFMPTREKSQVEKWCNQFAFAFLIDKHDEAIVKAYRTFKDNPRIESLAFLQRYHVSRLAFLTHLVDTQEISWATYHALKSILQHEYEQKQQEKDQEKERQKVMGRKPKGSSPSAIISPLEYHIYKSAFFEGVIGEAELRENLNLKRPKNLKLNQREKLKLHREEKKFEAFLYG